MWCEASLEQLENHVGGGGCDLAEISDLWPILRILPTEGKAMIPIEYHHVFLVCILRAANYHCGIGGSPYNNLQSSELAYVKNKLSILLTYNVHDCLQ